MACMIRLDRRPPPGQYCLTVSNISPEADLAKLEQRLRSSGGPLDNFIHHKSQFGTGESHFATVQFFCATDCERFRHECDGMLFSGRRIRVTPLKRSSGWSPTPLELSASNAIELMNHFVGFNGWSSEIIGIQLISASSVGPHSAGASSSRGANSDCHAGFEAKVVVKVAGSDIAIQGVGVGDTGTILAGAAGFEAVARRKKSAITNAVKAALSRLIIVLFPSGKVVVREVGAAAG